MINALVEKSSQKYFEFVSCLAGYPARWLLTSVVEASTLARKDWRSWLARDPFFNQRVVSNHFGILFGIAQLERWPYRQAVSSASDGGQASVVQVCFGNVKEDRGSFLNWVSCHSIGPGQLGEVVARGWNHMHSTMPNVWANKPCRNVH